KKVCPIGEHHRPKSSVDCDDTVVEEVMRAQPHRVGNASPLVLVAKRQTCEAVDFRDRERDEDLCLVQKSRWQGQPPLATHGLEAHHFSRLLAEIHELDTELLADSLELVSVKSVARRPQAVAAVRFHNGDA